MDFDAYRKRMEWYTQARFGMFIHWGLYAIPARGEWVRSAERIPVEDYQIFFDDFNPVAYDPKKWAKAAKHAGMKYAVLTAKHHDGFCLFDSALTEYKSTNTPCGRDLVREYVEAFRGEGIKVGLYYSLLDWHHPDYPHYGDAHHPMRENKAFAGTKHNFQNYLEYMHGQVREICTNYGKLDILWFDFSYDSLRGEAWGATKLIEMVRSLQPDVIIDNRLEASGEGFGSLMTENPSFYCGDFVSPEQVIPPKGIVRDNGEPAIWEACITMNNHWGYSAFDKNFKSSATCVRKLVECVSKGGNLLLNVGPDAKGRIPSESLAVLEGIGEWMEKNSESIYGCGSADVEKPDCGRITRKGNKLFIHVLEQPIGPVAIHGVRPEDIRSIRLLPTGAELHITNAWTAANYPDHCFVPIGPDDFGTYDLPDPIDTVIEITLK